MPSTRSWPRFVIHRPSSMRCVVLPLSDTLNASPRANSSPAKVTMNGGIASLPISVPCRKPMVPHTAIGRTIPTNEPHCEPYAASTAASAYIEPTERSIPPLMMTNVIPMATIPRNEEATARFEKLAVLAKLVPNRITPSTITQASTTAAADRWMSETTVPDVAGAAVVSQ